MLPREPSPPDPPTMVGSDAATQPVPPAQAPRVPAPGTSGPLTIGQSLGTRYRILGLLGRGGMGAVYKAWDDQLGLAVALKTIALAPDANADTAALLEQRFRREALLARQITHRNVVRVHDVGEFEGIRYLTMAFVEGETLSDLMRRRGRMPPQDILPIVRQVAEGLVAAHGAGVVHRDLKPANIMITPSGEACIMDFGIARSAQTTMTQAGMIVGTLEYMAPEQLHGEAVDGRTDVYALGLIAYDMLLGRGRLNGVDQPMMEALGRSRQPLPGVASRRPEVPAPLADLVNRAIRPIPDERFASAQALLDYLSTLATDGHTRRELAADTHTHPVPAPTPRLLVRALRGAAIVIAAGVMSIGAWQWRDRAGGGAAAAAPPPTSVVVAEFANRTGEAIFDGLLDQAITIGLEGASFINVYPRRDALRQAAQIKAMDLGLDTSRLIGLREGIPLVVSGSIESAGDAYRLAVQVHETAPGGARVLDWTTEAANRDRVLEEAGRMAVQVRRVLGDGTVDVSAMHANETFTAGSLEAAAEYVRGQEMLAAGNRQAASEAYERAVKLDPDLGRAWAGMGTVAYNQRRVQDAERYLRQAIARTDRMTDREKFRTRGTYYDVMGNPDQARDELEALVARFPSDGAGLANLALAHFKAWHFPRALEVGRQAASLYPKNVLRQSNVALYALYASDFETAARQVEVVRSLSADYPYAQLAATMIDLATGRWEQAAAGYERLGTLPSPGPSLAVHGLADLARHRGRLEEAEYVLKGGLNQADDASRDRLTTALAAVRASRGDTRGAVEVLTGLSGEATDPGALVEAGETYLSVGRRAEALGMAERISRRLGLQGDTFATVLRAQIALGDGRAREAQSTLLETKGRADAWLVRYWLGRSYLALGAFAEADSEFDACLRRRGEALAVFLDDYPTYHRLADVHYYQGLARTGLDSAGAQDAFRAFLALKGNGDEGGALVADARSRLETNRTDAGRRD